MKNFSEEEIKRFKEEAQRAKEKRELAEKQPGYSREWNPDTDWGLE